MAVEQILHYFAVGLAIFLSSIGTGIGQGIAGAYGLESLTRQILGNDQAFRAMVIGLALIESGCIFALVLSLLLITMSPQVISLGYAISEIGVGLAIGCAAAAVGIASSFVVKGACQAIARQPFFSLNITTLMLLSQSIIEAPVIFAFIICLMIKLGINSQTTIFEGIKFLSSGLVIALGAIGPSIGQALFAHNSQQGIGQNSSSYRSVFTFSLLNQAVIETPVIFSLLLSFLILFFSNNIVSFSSSMAFFAAALSMGLGSIGTGIANGYVGSKGCEQIAVNPLSYAPILRATLLSQAIIEASVIYAFIISLLLLTRI